MDQQTILGQVIDDNYQLTAVIGSGASSTVYEALHLSMHRTVAIKIMHVHLTGKDETVARFHREGQLTSRLSHLNITQVFASGITESRQPYLVMERLYGRTLSERLLEGPLSRSEFQVVATALGAALGYAHQHGVVHRDIKPSNIFVADSFSSVKLLDFGIAKILGGIDQRLTATGALVGSLAYMSPEQLKAQPVDNRSDIFSFGRVLKECLTGQKDVSLKKQPQSSSGAGEDLLAIIDRCTAENPEHRYQSISEVMPELDLALSKNNYIVGRTKPRSWALNTVATMVLIIVVATVGLLLSADMLSARLSKENLYQLSIPLRQARLKLAPKTSPDQNILYGKLYADLALDYQNSGNAEDAAAYRKRAIDELAYGISEKPDLVDVKVLTSQLDRISDTLVKVLQVKGGGEYPLSYLRDAYVRVADSEGKSGRFKEQLAYYLVRLATEQQFPNQYVSLAEGYWDVAATYHSLGNGEKALEYIDKSIGTFRKDPGAQFYVAEATARKSSYLQSMNKHAEARELLQASLDSSHFEVKPAAMARLWKGFSDYHRTLSQTAEAIECLKRAISFYEKSGQEWRIADSNGELAKIYISEGQYALALPCAQKARRGMVELGNFEEADKIANQFDLTLCLRRLGRIKESEDIYKVMLQQPVTSPDAVDRKRKLINEYNKMVAEKR